MAHKSNKKAKKRKDFTYKFNKGAKKRKDFKTQDQYLDYIFEQNRGKLAEVFGANARERFKGAVESYKIAYDTNINGAIQKLANTTAFTPEVEKFTSNMWKSLKKFKAVKQFQYLTRKKDGTFAEFYPDKLKWDSKERAYTYDDKVMISFDNSPQQIKLTDLSTGSSYVFGGVE